MSYIVVDKIIKSTQFNCTEKMVLIALASFGKDDGTNIFPSHDTIAKRSGTHKRTVIRAIDTLVKKGVILKKSVSQDNLKRPNNYAINVDKIQCDTESHRCDNMSRGVVTQSHYGSDTESHKPTIEPTNINQSGATQKKPKYDLYKTEPKELDQNSRDAAHIRDRAAEMLQRYIIINSPDIIHYGIFKKLLDEGFQPEYIGGAIEDLCARFENKPPRRRLTSWGYIETAIRNN